MACQCAVFSVSLWLWCYCYQLTWEEAGLPAVAGRPLYISLSSTPSSIYCWVGCVCVVLLPLKDKPLQGRCWYHIFRALSRGCDSGLHGISCEPGAAQTAPFLPCWQTTFSFPGQYRSVLLMITFCLSVWHIFFFQIKGTAKRGRSKHGIGEAKATTWRFVKKQNHCLDENAPIFLANICCWCASKAMEMAWLRNVWIALCLSGDS